MGSSRDAVERAYAAMGTHDIDALIAGCSPSCELIDGPVRLHGREQIGPYLQAYFTAFPDLRLDVRSMLEDGDAVAAEVTFTGTQTGPLATPNGEIPPSGRKIDLEAADFLTVVDGKIATWRAYLDMAEFRSQIGLTPTAAQAVPAG